MGVLPVVSPIVDVLPGYANTLSVLLNNTSGINWFMENYIHMYGIYDQNTGILYSAFCNIDHINIAAHYHYMSQNLACPLIKSYTIPKHIMDYKKSYVDTLCNLIDQGYYVVVNVKQSNISICRKYGRQDVHELFFYGYEKAKQIFYIGGYFPYYKFTTCMFSEVEAALMAANEDQIENKKDCAIQVLIKSDCYNIFQTNCEVNYEFHIDKTRDLISDYLQCRNVMDNSKMWINDQIHFKKLSYAWGQDWINLLINYIRCSGSSELRGVNKQLSIMKSHKRSLKAKTRFLYENCYIDDYSLVEDADNLYDKSCIILQMALKQEFTIGKIDFDKMEAQINQLRSMETNFLESILKKLKA